MRDAEMLAEAALDAVQIPLHAAQRGRSMAQLALAGAARFEAWRHYPAGDARDAAHGTQFYFHAHDRARGPGEHGHFHLFVRELLPGRFHHLAALSVDALGRPLRWFTTNGWVTGEHYLPAAALRPALQGFALAQRGRLAPLARWLQALVRLHAEEIEALLHERDARLQRAAAGRTLDAVLADRRLELLSLADIDLARRIAALTHDIENPEGDPEHADDETEDDEILARAAVRARLGHAEPGGRLARPGGGRRLAGGASERGAGL